VVVTVVVVVVVVVTRDGGGEGSYAHGWLEAAGGDEAAGLLEAETPLVGGVLLLAVDDRAADELCGMSCMSCRALAACPAAPIALPH
jgi:hypothetical protein